MCVCGGGGGGRGHGNRARLSAKCVRQWDVVFGITFSISFVL